MKEGLFSKEILEVIFKNIKIFNFTVIIIFTVAVWKIVTPPQEYKTTSYFRYMGADPGEVTIKKDNKGTITLVQYQLGKGNLDIHTLFKSPEYQEIKGKNGATLIFDKGNGNHILEVRGVDPEEILAVSHRYMEKFLESNKGFLEKKISYTENNNQKESIRYELLNEEMSFPLMIKAQEVERVESKKTVYLFFAFIIATFIGVITTFIAQIIKEARGRE